MIKNLSKKRFLIYLSVAIFLMLVIFVQYIVLAVLRGKNQDLDNQLTDITQQIENIPQVSEEDKKDYARWEKGYTYDDETILVGE